MVTSYNRDVSDRLYLSCWVKNFNQTNMLKHLESLSEVFPFSKLAKRGPILRIYGVERVEPPLTEREFGVSVEIESLIASAREFASADCAFEIDTYWDLWQFDKEWALKPAAVTLVCAGPEFDNEAADHLRIEFGIDAHFLPAKGVEGSPRMAQSNLRSLIHLVDEVGEKLPLTNRKLWSESGINFAELLTETLSRYEPN